MLHVIGFTHNSSGKGIVYKGQTKKTKKEKQYVSESHDYNYLIF